MLDASRAVGVASRLVSDTQRDALVAQDAQPNIDDDPRDPRRQGPERAGARSRRRAPTPSAYDPADKAPAPQQPGRAHFADWPLHELRERIDWTPFFRAWELAGNYPAILEDKVVGESARKLFADAARCSTGSSPRSG